jgi:type IV secretory pathway VirB3-like protein
MWIFLMLAIAVFLYVGARALQLEAHHFEEVTTTTPSS